MDADDLLQTPAHLTITFKPDQHVIDAGGPVEMRVAQGGGVVAIYSCGLVLYHYNLEQIADAYEVCLADLVGTGLGIKGREDADIYPVLDAKLDALPVY